MLDITPTKLLIVLVFGLIILGPDKLPRVARQVGEAWSNLKGFRQRMEDEMKGVFPQLPSTTEIASAVRSPISLLDRLAASHETSKAAESRDTDTVKDTALDTDADSTAGADTPLDGTIPTSGNSEGTTSAEEPDPAREVVRSVYGLSRSQGNTPESISQAANTSTDGGNFRDQDRPESREPATSYVPIPPDDPTFN